MEDLAATIEDLRRFADGKRYNTIYANPPWKFQNSTGKVSPGYKRLKRYDTMTVDEIRALPVEEIAGDKAHLYLWVPNALLPDGLAVMDAWGFEYKGNLVWEKVRSDGEPDGRGMGFYFRNVTELLLFGIRKKSAPNRTLAPARSQVNLIRSMKREYSRKPDEIVPIIEACSQGPRIELFAGGTRPGWDLWGDEAAPGYVPTWGMYADAEPGTMLYGSDAAAKDLSLFMDSGNLPYSSSETWEQMELDLPAADAEQEMPGDADMEWEQMELDFSVSCGTVPF